MIDIAIDFDGTCVYHEYPEVGDDVPGAVEVLKELVHKGHNLILYSMRSGGELEDAMLWFRRREIPLYGVQVNPSQQAWTKSPKCYAQIYIDDAALGCPLNQDPQIARKFVDWPAVKVLLKNQGVL